MHYTHEKCIINSYRVYKVGKSCFFEWEREGAMKKRINITLDDDVIERVDSYARQHYHQPVRCHYHADRRCYRDKYKKERRTGIIAMKSTTEYMIGNTAVQIVNKGKQDLCSRCGKKETERPDSEEGTGDSDHGGYAYGGMFLCGASEQPAGYIG